MNTKKFFVKGCLAMFIAFVMSSCVMAINGSGYNTLSDAEKNRVVVCQDGIENLHNDGMVYLITVEQLQRYLDASERVLIYEYLYYCKSEYCVNPVAVEKDCQSKGVRFLLLNQNYEGVFNLPPLESPLLAVNPAPFGKKITKGCTEQFFNQLTATTFKTRGYGRYYLFENGKFAGCFNDYREALGIKTTADGDKNTMVSLK